MVALFFFVAILLLSICYLTLNHSPLKKLPGPLVFPVLGNVPQLNRTKLYLQLAEFAKQYGGIFKIHFFFKPIVVVSDYHYIQQVLVSRSKEFAGRPSSYRDAILGQHLGAIALMDAGQVVQGRRQTVQNFLELFAVGAGIQQIDEAMQISTEDLIRRIAEHDGRPIQVRDFLFHSVIDIFAILLMGDTISDDDKSTLITIMDTLNEAIHSEGGMMLYLFPFIRFFWSKTYKQIQDVIKVKDQLLADWVDRRPMAGFIHDIQTMSVKDEKKSFVDTERIQRDMFFELLMSGSLSTVNTLNYLMNVLCHHPYVQEDLREELLEVIGPSRHPVLAEKTYMPRLMASLFEICRYSSVSPVTFPHKAVKTCNLGKYKIPKGTEVWVNLWARHHCEGLWERPYEFRPERFLDIHGQLVDEDHHRLMHLLSFGAGHRECVGAEFGIDRIFLITARILQTFTILPESTLDQQPSCDPMAHKMGLFGLSPQFKVRMVPVRTDDASILEPVGAV